MESNFDWRVAVGAIGVTVVLFSLCALAFGS